MDPRPYNYEYRKPRLTNRTQYMCNQSSQSYNAYESLYHMGKINPALYGNNIMQDSYLSRLNRYQSVAEKQPTRMTPQPKYELPVDNYPKHYENIGINTDRYSNRQDSNRSVKSRSSSMSVPSINGNHLPIKPSVLSTYGSNSLEQRNQGSQKQPPMPSNSQKVNVVFSHINDTSEVFKRQQKPFDIINHYSKHSEPLRKFPKLSKEDLILQRGMDTNI